MSALFTIGKNIYIKLPVSLKYQIRKIYEMGMDKSSYSKSYSQCGEDMVVKSILNPQPVNKKLMWIDIGAHHPTRLNNTAFFYEQGCHGINVEADPKLIQNFYYKRKRDVNLNIAVADKSGEMDFYLMDAPTLNTLSAVEAHKNEKLGHKITGIIPIKTMTITDVLGKYCENIFPDFLSLDAEGYDLTILRSIDWEKAHPKIICVENIPYLPKLKNFFESMQINELSRYLETKNYSIIAFTLINTIFVHNDYIEKG
jgi:FkbM family methyltransferase